MEAQMDFEQFIFPFMVRCSAFPRYFLRYFTSTERDTRSQRGCAPHPPKGGLGLETSTAVPAIFGVETTGSTGTGMEHGCVLKWLYLDTPHITSQFNEIINEMRINDEQ
jgi:hypothetical protein